MNTAADIFLVAACFFAAPVAGLVGVLAGAIITWRLMHGQCPVPLPQRKAQVIRPDKAPEASAVVKRPSVKS